MKRKFKIAIILPTLISQNGPAKQAIELGKALINLGHRVEFSLLLIQ
ncbi:MAG: hypothetical protein ACOY0S_02985 [Patescibacteria group bacterium]